MATLNVNIGTLELKNPVMTASGTFGYGLEFADLVPLDEIGGIIVKGAVPDDICLRTKTYDGGRGKKSKGEEYPM